MLCCPYAHSTTSGISFPAESEAMDDSSITFTEIKTNITARDFPSQIDLGFYLTDVASGTAGLLKVAPILETAERNFFTLSFLAKIA